MQQKKLIAYQKEYGDKLMYINMANSPAFWIQKATKLHRQAQYSAVAGSNSCYWFRLQRSTPPMVKRRSSIHRCDELFKYLTDTLIPEQRSNGIPKSPTMDLPARKYTPQLGMRTVDVGRLDECYEDEDKAIEEAVAMRNKLGMRVSLISTKSYSQHHPK
jgi:hypothetical protein